MKTFDEAVNLALPKGDDSGFKSLAEDLIPRHYALVVEASHNKPLRFAILALIECADDPASPMDFEDVMFTMFVNGMIVGIEMEKP